LSEEGSHHEGYVSGSSDKTKILLAIYDENGQCIFDGKIGMWPFVEHDAAQRQA
jgi:hypothetical protein